MDIAIVFSVVFIALLTCVYVGVSLVFPLLMGLICFIILAVRKGFALTQLLTMVVKGSGRSLIVLKIFLLIGVITAVWRACGTVAYIVYYGLGFMSSDYFLVSSFLLCSLVSFLLGTSFGTVGTVGVVLIVLAKSGSVDVNAAAGAIIAGAYFGDRCSPMSSSASLVAVLTKTSLYVNIKNMLKTTVVPFGLAIPLYVLLSYKHPLVFQDNQIASQILQSFDIGHVLVIPAAIILLAAICKVDVKASMLLSILTGILIAIFIQNQSLQQLMSYVLTGYHLDNDTFLASVIKGGGVYSMLNVGFIVLISSAYSGIFEGTGLLKEIEVFVEKASRKIGVYLTVILMSTASAAFACNQTLAVMLTHQFLYKIYDKLKISNNRLALDLENTVIVIAAIIPWNIAGAFPASALSADWGFIAHAYYLFLIPLTNMGFRMSEITQDEKVKTKA